PSMSSRTPTRNSPAHSADASRTGKGRGGSGKVTRFRAIDGEKAGVVFEDPRSKHDRRREYDEEAIPASGCRRHNDRRSDRLNLGVWWMKRNYCVDLTVRKRVMPARDSNVFRRGDQA
ncbi:MAG: hypothetical protein WBN40_03465, partial [Pseudomonadales bacterium]